MRPEAARICVVSLLALLAGCSTMESLSPARSGGQAPAPVVDRDTTVALMLASTIQTLQRLTQAAPAEQAEILVNARRAYERAPLGSAQLTYALVLAVPGHAGRDADRARQLLRELTAQPEALAPVERALTQVQLAQVERELGLQTDNDRLLTESQRGDRERLAVANRRLQNETEENAKLRKQLEEAQAKLEAIAKIERNLTERQSATEGRKP